jgi:hypothetical protein
MTDGWINALVWILFAATLGAITAWLHTLIKRNEDQFLSLVDALNSAGAGLHHTGIGYVATGYVATVRPDQPPLFTSDPQALNPTTLRAVTETSHALHDPLVSQPPGYTGPGARDWLLHYTHRPDVTWAGVTKQFYGEAAQDDEIKAFFANTDMALLKRHFAETLIIITRDGVSESLLQAIKHAHSHITDRDGKPLRITDYIYDKVIDVLVGVLQRNGVPPRAISDLAKTITPLKDVIVVG